MLEGGAENNEGKGERNEEFNRKSSRIDIDMKSESNLVFPFKCSSNLTT